MDFIFVIFGKIKLTITSFSVIFVIQFFGGVIVDANETFTIFVYKQCNFFICRLALP